MIYARDYGHDGESLAITCSCMFYENIPRQRVKDCPQIAISKIPPIQSRNSSIAQR